MKILGLSSNYHDASAALVIDGHLVAASTEERFSLIKHDPSFPRLSSQFCIESHNLKFSDLDLVAYHEDPNVKFTRTLSASFARYPFSRQSFVKTMQEALASGLKIKSDISRKLNIPNEKIIYTPHHMSHAAHAYLTSSFDEAAIVTIDAVGEWTCSGIFYAKGNKIEPIDGIFFPHSLGLIYSAFTAFLGFKANDGECSTMALAAFGQPIYADQVRQIIKVQKDGRYEIDMSYFDFGNWDSLPISAKFIKAFGEPRPFGTPIEFSCFDKKQILKDKEQQRYADVAASVQKVLEEAILAYIQRARNLTGCRHLCFAGGVALNAVANSKIISSQIFDDVFVPLDPGDGGAASGSALYLAQQYTHTKIKDTAHPYLGAFASTEKLDWVKSLDSKKLAAFSKTHRPFKFEMDKLNDDQRVIDFAASEILQGKVIGWVQGRFENGPRALGNRSILCRADQPDVAKRLSQKIKKRAFFRPYALSIHESESEWTASEAFKKSSLSRWMQTSAPLTSEFQNKFSSAVHVDGTTRPQITSSDFNPRFSSLLANLKSRTGHGVLLNTSFNESGFPLIASENEALMMFFRTEMDTLIIDQCILRKEWQDGSI